MKKNSYLLPLLGSLPALLSCSALMDTPPLSKTRIEPLMQVRSADNTAQGYYQLGRYYMGQNRLELAAEAYRKAIELSAGYVDAHNALGIVYSEQGKFEDAIKELTTALKIVPDVARVYNNLGYTYYLQNNFAGAVLAYEKAIALEPHNQRAYNNLGAAYDKLGDPEKSRLAFQHAEELNTPAVALTAAQAPAIVATPEPVVAATPSVAAGAPATAAATPASIDLATLSQATNIVNPAASYALPVTHTSIALADEPGPNVDLAVTSMPASQIPAVTASALAQPVSPGAAGAMANLPPLAFQAAPPPLRPQPDIDASNKLPAAAAKPEASKPFRLEIANGNGITGLARKVKKTLLSQGLPAARLTNIKPYQERQTVIQYRAAFQEQAFMLSKKLLKTPKLVQSEKLRVNADLRLVLGKDVGSQVALFGSDSEETLRLAYNEQKP